MTALSNGTIPMTMPERKGLNTIQNVCSITREGPTLQVEDRKGGVWQINAKGKVFRIG